MTIQRQYSLPNCKLILEGLTNDNPLDAATARPLVSMVTNVECHLSAMDKPLVGGREFLESLARVVSEYAQDYLSGIPHAARRDRRESITAIQVQPIGKNLHRLSIQPQAVDGGSANGNQTASFPPPTEIDLTTVQLFDLVEAIDQLFADAQTVPELSLNLSPLPKRFVVSQEPIQKRAVPAALGVSGLAVAAAALFFLPIPEVRRPETTTDPTTQTSPTASATPSPGNSPEATPPETTSPSSEVSVSPSPTSSPIAQEGSSSAASPSATSEDLEALLQSSRNIADPVELERLTADLQTTLYTGWLDKPAPSFAEPLEYRVGVDETGRIIGYRFVNDEAATYLDEIPLSDVQFAASTTTSSATPSNSATPTEAASDPSIAQFLVVFRPDGVLEISPWYGLPPEEPSDDAAEEQTDSSLDAEPVEP